ncbi:hypothetical protein MKX01_038183 [Papaver californicum]|nr:hypothetical protein MKX01_038183 [Papaver californicum]
MWYKSEPFILTSQSQQVFYLDDYKHGPNWKVAQKIHHKHIWDIPEMDINKVELETEASIHEAYNQNEDEEGPLLLSNVQEDDNQATVLQRDDDVALGMLDIEIVLVDDVMDDDDWRRKKMKRYLTIMMMW